MAENNELQPQKKGRINDTALTDFAGVFTFLESDIGKPVNA
jgi:hypothetical protein